MEILVVEENRATRKMVRFALERRGHRVTEASDAQTAVSSVGSGIPDLILQDLRLPDADGFLFAGELRELTGAMVPIVAFASEIVPMASLRAAGFAGVIAKPIEPARLVEQVEAHLRRQNVQRAQRANIALVPDAPPARQSMHAALYSSGPAAHLAQRCSELTSQLAIVEGMTAAVLEEPDVESLLGELLSAWFNAGGFSGGALYLKGADDAVTVRCLGAWLAHERAAKNFFDRDEALQSTLLHGAELRLPTAKLSGPVGAFGAHEVLLIPLQAGETIFGALAVASLGPSWSVWDQLARSVARRIAQLCAHERLRTEQRVATENARRQAALMTALVQNAPDIIAHLDREGRVQFVNRSEFKVSATQVIGRSFLDFVQPNERERVTGFLAQVVRGGAPVSYEIEASTDKDAPVWYSCRMGPVRERGEVVGVVLVCRDISMQRAIEARLRVADRMAAIGTLAAGVAHEINTPIQYVANNLGFVVACVNALTATEPPTRGVSRAFALERLPTALADCEDGVKRVAAITHAMRTFSHPGGDYDKVDLNDCLNATIEMTRHAWKDVADLEVDLDPDLPMMTGSPAELNQVLLNIVVNAGHAIEDAQKLDGRRGKIHIASRFDEEGFLVIEIGDNGAGIPVAAQARVYDLFFTTKEVGRGSGQGLALAHSIVTGHGGTIRFETREQEGTTFILRLPTEGANHEDVLQKEAS